MSLTGKTIGRYRIIEQLGQGGMAVVYKAFDTRLERDVAVKVIRTEDIPPSQLKKFLQRFEREAKTQSKFHHPNIVPIHDFGEHEGSPFLVMTYLPSGTLRDLTGTPMPYPQAAALLAPIADALAYAHEKDVLHRDIKPSNILLGEKGIPALTDFGIAKLLGEMDSATLTGTGMGIGTPQYMAPEQWKGLAEKATDIYALGVVFYELITGRKPYDADTPAALILIQANEPLPRPTDFVPDLPEHVEKVLYKALAPQPEDRYENMAEFAKVLQKLSTEELVLDGLSREEVTAAEPEPALPQTEVMLPIEEQAEEPAGPEPTTPEPIEPVVVPTLYPQETPTEATPLPAEPEIEETPELPPTPKPKSTFKMPVWGWGLIGVIVLAGIVFGVMQMGGGGTPVGNAATETGTEAAAIADTNTKLPTLTLAPTQTLIPTATFTPTSEPTPIGGGSGKIVFASDRDGDMEIYVMNVDGSGLEQITDNDVFDGYPAWSPDGEKIAFISDRNGKEEIYIFNIKENEIIQVTDTNNTKLHLVWSNENEILFTGANARTFIDPNYTAMYWLYYKLTISNGNIERLPFDPDMYLPYHSDAPNIVQYADDYIYVVNSGVKQWNENTGNKKILKNTDYSEIAVSSNSNKILVVTGGYTSFEKIYILEQDENLIQISPNDGNYNQPGFSSDGTMIVCSSDRDGDEDLYIMDADGSNITQLTDSPGFDGYPDWAP